jgi:hypothetical protein
MHCLRALVRCLRVRVCIYVLFDSARVRVCVLFKSARVRFARFTLFSLQEHSLCEDPHWNLEKVLWAGFE